VLIALVLVPLHGSIHRPHVRMAIRPSMLFAAGIMTGVPSFNDFSMGDRCSGLRTRAVGQPVQNLIRTARRVVKFSSPKNQSRISARMTVVIFI